MKWSQYWSTNPRYNRVEFKIKINRDGSYYLFGITEEEFRELYPNFTALSVDGKLQVLHMYNALGSEDNGREEFYNISIVAKNTYTPAHLKNTFYGCDITFRLEDVLYSDFWDRYKEHGRYSYYPTDESLVGKFTIQTGRRRQNPANDAPDDEYIHFDGFLASLSDEEIEKVEVAEIFTIDKFSVEMLDYRDSLPNLKYASINLSDIEISNIPTSLPNFIKNCTAQLKHYRGNNQIKIVTTNFGDPDGEIEVEIKRHDSEGWAFIKQLFDDSNAKTKMLIIHDELPQEMTKEDIRFLLDMQLFEYRYGNDLFRHDGSTAKHTIQSGMKYHYHPQYKAFIETFLDEYVGQEIPKESEEDEQEYISLSKIAFGGEFAPFSMHELVADGYMLQNSTIIVSPYKEYKDGAYYHFILEEGMTAIDTNIKRFNYYSYPYNREEEEAERNALLAAGVAYMQKLSGKNLTMNFNGNFSSVDIAVKTFYFSEGKVTITGNLIMNDKEFIEKTACFKGPIPIPEPMKIEKDGEETYVVPLESYGKLRDLFEYNPYKLSPTTIKVRSYLSNIMELAGNVEYFESTQKFEYADTGLVYRLNPDRFKVTGRRDRRNLIVEYDGHTLTCLSFNDHHNLIPEKYVDAARKLVYTVPTQYDYPQADSCLIYDKGTKELLTVNCAINMPDLNITNIEAIADFQFFGGRADDLSKILDELDSIGANHERQIELTGCLADENNLSKNIGELTADALSRGVVLISRVGGELRIPADTPIGWSGKAIANLYYPSTAFTYKDGSLTVAYTVVSPTTHELVSYPPESMIGKLGSNVVDLANYIHNAYNTWILATGINQRNRTYYLIQQDRKLYLTDADSDGLLKITFDSDLKMTIAKGGKEIKDDYDTSEIPKNAKVTYSTTKLSDGTVEITYVVHDEDGNDITDRVATLSVGDKFLHKDI